MKGLRGIIIFFILVALLVVGGFYITGRAVSRNNIAAAPVPVKPVAIAPPSYCTDHYCIIYNGTTVNWKGNLIYAQVGVHPWGALFTSLVFNGIRIDSLPRAWGGTIPGSELLDIRNRSVVLYASPEDLKINVTPNRARVQFIELCSGNGCPNCTPFVPVQNFFGYGLRVSEPRARYISEMGNHGLGVSQVLDLGLNGKYDANDTIFTIPNYYDGQFSDSGFSLSRQGAFVQSLILCTISQSSSCVSLFNDSSQFNGYAAYGDYVYWMTSNYQLMSCKYSSNNAQNECLNGSIKVFSLPYPPFNFRKMVVLGEKVLLYYKDSAGQNYFFVYHQPTGSLSLLQNNFGLMDFGTRVFNETHIIGQDRSRQGTLRVLYNLVNDSIRLVDVFSMGSYDQIGETPYNIYFDMAVDLPQANNSMALRSLYMGGRDVYVDIFPMIPTPSYVAMTMTKRNELFYNDDGAMSPNPQQVYYSSCT